nr:immunoglobulin heavy chain junction region [Macaca mulatta]MOV53486.1 immunoglobulin heavy chain junction region [Macaca mulatta]MOV53516.1 immunoglobulin heavy chain junction region [Macaca mulatta]MOV53950.1 immunoglobulin heavy chain junction region [Macaca mulatta]MOV54127.1 immunoglobulin heavy chain junction region [Macaca mulatta]
CARSRYSYNYLGYFDYW